MTNNPRALFVVAAAAAVLFLFALINQYPEHRQQVTSMLSNTASKAWQFRGKKTYGIAKEKGADKVKGHSYRGTDDKYYPAIRHKRVKML